MSIQGLSVNDYSAIIDIATLQRIIHRGPPAPQTAHTPLCLNTEKTLLQVLFKHLVLVAAAGSKGTTTAAEAAAAATTPAAAAAPQSQKEQQARKKPTGICISLNEETVTPAGLFLKKKSSKIIKSHRQDS